MGAAASRARASDPDADAAAGHEAPHHFWERGPEKIDRGSREATASSPGASSPAPGIARLPTFVGRHQPTALGPFIPRVTAYPALYTPDSAAAQVVDAAADSGPVLGDLPTDTQTEAHALRMLQQLRQKVAGGGVAPPAHAAAAVPTSVSAPAAAAPAPPMNVAAAAIPARPVTLGELTGVPTSAVAATIPASHGAADLTFEFTVTLPAIPRRFALRKTLGEFLGLRSRLTTSLLPAAPAPFPPARSYSRLLHPTLASINAEELGRGLRSWLLGILALPTAFDYIAVREFLEISITSFEPQLGPRYKEGWLLVTSHAYHCFKRSLAPTYDRLYFILRNSYLTIHPDSRSPPSQVILLDDGLAAQSGWVDPAATATWCVPMVGAAAPVCGSVSGPVIAARRTDEQHGLVSTEPASGAGSSSGGGGAAAPMAQQAGATPPVVPTAGGVQTAPLATHGRRLRGATLRRICLSTRQGTITLLAPTRKEAEDWILALRRRAGQEGSTWCRRTGHPLSSFAPPRKGVEARWLIDANNTFANMVEALKLAQHEICISGWWLTPELLLVRDPVERQRLEQVFGAGPNAGAALTAVTGSGSVTLGALAPAASAVPGTGGDGSAAPPPAVGAAASSAEDADAPPAPPAPPPLAGPSVIAGGITDLHAILLERARAGVHIYILLWAEPPMTYPLESWLIKRSLNAMHPNVHAMRHGGVLWTHHDKIVVVDRCIAFVGGLDIAFARWDTGAHVIVDPDKRRFPQGIDCYNPRYAPLTDVKDPWPDRFPRTLPRMAWHDVHSVMRGSIVDDVVRHFVQRWLFTRNTKNKLGMPLLLPHGPWAPELRQHAAQLQRRAEGMPALSLRAAVLAARLAGGGGSSSSRGVGGGGAGSSAEVSGGPPVSAAAFLQPAATRRDRVRKLLWYGILREKGVQTEPAGWEPQLAATASPAAAAATLTAGGTQPSAQATGQATTESGRLPSPTGLPTRLLLSPRQPTVSAGTASGPAASGSSSASSGTVSTALQGGAAVALPRPPRSLFDLVRATSHSGDGGAAAGAPATIPATSTVAPAQPPAGARGKRAQGRPTVPTATSAWYCCTDWTDAWHNSNAQIVRSVGQWSTGTSTESSVFRAYIHAILTSEHSIYVENQYFLSSLGWTKAEVDTMQLGLEIGGAAPPAQAGSSGRGRGWGVLRSSLHMPGAASRSGAATSAAQPQPMATRPAVAPSLRRSRSWDSVLDALQLEGRRGRRRRTGSRSVIMLGGAPAPATADSPDGEGPHAFRAEAAAPAGAAPRGHRGWERLRARAGPGSGAVDASAPSLDAPVPPAVGATAVVSGGATSLPALMGEAGSTASGNAAPPPPAPGRAALKSLLDALKRQQQVDIASSSQTGPAPPPLPSGAAMASIETDSAAATRGVLQWSPEANSVAEALYVRICRAIDEGKPYRAVIILPVAPDGDIRKDRAIQLVFHWQARTISRGGFSLLERLQARYPGVDISKYLAFYALRSYDWVAGPDGTKKAVCEQIYVHAKLLIVDDRLVIIGSANLNDRSLFGSRDSEIALVVSGGDKVISRMGGAPFTATVFAHTLRRALMMEHLGLAHTCAHYDPNASGFFASAGEADRTHALKTRSTLGRPDGRFAAVGWRAIRRDAEHLLDGPERLVAPTDEHRAAAGAPPRAALLQARWGGGAGLGGGGGQPSGEGGLVATGPSGHLPPFPAAQLSHPARFLHVCPGGTLLAGRASAAGEGAADGGDGSRQPPTVAPPKARLHVRSLTGTPLPEVQTAGAPTTESGVMTLSAQVPSHVRDATAPPALCGTAGPSSVGELARRAATGAPVTLGALAAATESSLLPAALAARDTIWTTLASLEGPPDTGCLADALVDPLDPTFMDGVWNAAVALNTHVYDTVFPEIIKDGTKTFAAWRAGDEAAPAHTELLACLVGKVVRWPTQFLADEDLSARATEKEGIVPSRVFQ